MKCFQAEVMNESVYMRIKHSREQAGRKRQNTGMIKGVIFDMDGTMFDTERLSSYCWKRTGENLGINVTDELMNDCRGRTLQSFVDYIWKHLERHSTMTLQELPSM